MREVLIVDYDPELREQAGHVLNGGVYALTYASDGMEALRIVKSKHFDLILVDLLMPGALNGIQILQGMHRNAPNSPLVVMSDRNGHRELETALRYGAREVLLKPVHRELMKAVADKLTGNPLRQKEPAHEPAYPGAPAHEPAHSGAPAHEPAHTGAPAAPAPVTPEAAPGTGSAPAAPLAGRPALRRSEPEARDAASAAASAETVATAAFATVPAAVLKSVPAEAFHSSPAEAHRVVPEAALAITPATMPAVAPETIPVPCAFTSKAPAAARRRTSPPGFRAHIFSGIPEPALETLMAEGEEVVLRAGEEFSLDICESMAILVSGQARCWYKGLLVRILDSGDSIGEAALFSKTAASLPLVLDGTIDLVLCILSRKTLRSFFQRLGSQHVLHFSARVVQNLAEDLVQMYEELNQTQLAALEVGEGEVNFPVSDDMADDRHEWIR
ncbi:MAG TPA: response regulator [bacterium]|nr:response regulator [bacterium]HPR88631.1 response regulator [bacterium]